ncbi:DUF4395 domain-containing protein [Epilithonimonas mollis]|uniref:DUF4395 domain-containing protein n=1 Tax=Epilithonimonas mollis TaxID=216903 RepID=A0A1M6SA98_9FLAO|nr:DUF4395 domain-containing protein [Epilithonimonas mollis]SHK41641.1 protein of unknown function [Epilithonimonas mollis]
MEKFKNKTIYVDENVVSLVAYQVVLITVFGLHFQQQWLLLLLVIDFFIRASGIFMSPLSYTAKKISEFVYFEKKPVFAAPKRFAASLGLLMSLLIAVFYDSQSGIFLGVMLILFACAESVFHVCIGCYIYNYLVNPILRKFNSPKN